MTLQDKLLLTIVDGQDDDVQAALEELQANYRKLIAKYTRGDQLTDVESILKGVGELTAGFTVSLASIMLIANSQASSATVRYGVEKTLVPLLEKVPGSKSAIANLRRRPRQSELLIDVSLMQRRWPGTRKNISERLKTVQYGQERVVRYIIQDSQKRGLGAFATAKLIESYVIPDPNGRRVAPWTITRRILGKQISYIPRGVPAGSVSYNAMRIARSEIAHTFQQAPQEAFFDLWFVPGYYWNLSSAHESARANEKCEIYAKHQEGLGKGVWRVLPTCPHPHCMCHTGPAVLDDETFFRLLPKKGLNL